MIEECDALWEELERGKARYVIAYEEGVPTKLVFVGYRLIEMGWSGG